MKIDFVRGRPRAHPPSLTAPPGRRTARRRQTLLLVLLGLGIVTAYRQYRQQPYYQLRTFATSTGWGYAVVTSGTTLIYQPTVPGRAGRSGFSSQKQAETVGERVIQKLRSGPRLPTLTPQELRQLGVAVPVSDG